MVVKFKLVSYSNEIHKLYTAELLRDFSGVNFFLIFSSILADGASYDAFFLNKGTGSQESAQFLNQLLRRNKEKEKYRLLGQTGTHAKILK